jgi:gliding motility-associated-like protein
MQTNDPAAACILPSPQSLNCHMGVTNNLPIVAVPPSWCTTIENNHWYAFVADAPTVNFEIECTSCPGGGTGVQAAVLETADCANFNFVSPCYGNINAGSSQLVTGTGLVPGQVYYLMIDGQAGAGCNYSINGSSNNVGGAPTNLCIPSSNTGNYFADETSQWEIQPPTAGTILGSPISTNVNVIWTGVGSAQICATSLACPGAPPLCIPVTIGMDNQSTEEEEVCLGGAVVCGGQTFFAPGVYPITYQTWNGCDSNITCIVTPILPVFTDPFEDDICSPDFYEVCGNFYSTSGIYTATCMNWQGCDSTVTVDLAVMEPIPVIAPPDELGCGDDATLVLDGTGSNFNTATNGNTNFFWTGPGIIGPDDGTTITIDQPGEYCLELTHERNGVFCTETTCVFVEQNIEIPDDPSLNGETEICDGDIENYTVSPNGSVPPTGYIWITPNGEPFTEINSTTIEIDWTGSLGGDLCVIAENDCGESAPTCIFIEVSQGPEEPNLIGDDMVCDGDVEIYTITNPTSDATCTWTVPPGASFTDNGSSIEVDFDGATTGDVCVTCENECGVTDEVCITVDVTSPPAEPVFDSGPTDVCDGDMAQYCVLSDPNATDYTWDTPAGLFTNQGNCLDIDWTGLQSGNVCVTANSDCGESPQVCIQVTVNEAPTAVLSGMGEFCEGSGDAIELEVDLTGTSPWELTYSDGTNTFTESNIDVSPFIIPATVAGTYTLTDVTDATICPGQVSGSAEVTENPLPTVALTGSGAICEGSGQTVDLEIALTGTPNWTVNWTVNGNPQAPLNNITSSPFTLTIGQSQVGDIELTGVTDGNGCTNAGDGNVINIILNEAPNVSNISTLCNATSTGFTVSFEISGGDSNSYSVTSNTPGVGGSISTTAPFVFTSDEIPSGDGYSFVVNDANNCDPITVEDDAVLCDCTTEVGDMNLNLIEQCGTDEVTATYDNSTEVLDGDDAVEYVLHEGSGVSIVNQIANNSVPTFGFQGGMSYGTTYYISAIAGNDDGAGGVDQTDPCLAVAQGTPIVFYEVPSAFMIGDQAICEGEMTGLSIEFTGTGPWNLEYDDGTGTQTINGINANPFTLDVSPTALTTYTLTGVNDVNCPGEVDGAITVDVYTAVAIANLNTECNATSTQYTITFEILGGDPTSYQVTGVSGSISADAPYVFTSDPIPTGDGFNIDIDDANSCDPQNVNQNIVVCDCVTEVGDMNLDPVDECSDGPILANYDDSMEALDDDDLVQFVLHTGNVNLGSIIQTNNVEPSFGFDPATMNYGTTYYISAIAGSDDGTGNVDPDDPCFQFAQGTPVRFFEVPTAQLSGMVSICDGEEANLTLNLTGDSPWSVVINNDTISNIVNNPFTYKVNPNQTTQYVLQSVNDSNCPGDVVGEGTVTVNIPPTVNNIVVECNGTNTAFTVSFEIEGGDPACYTVAGSSGNLVGNVFTSNPIASGNGYFIEVDDCNECGPIVVEDPLVLCDCETISGEMQVETLEICGNGPAEATYLGGEVLDDDDELCFMIHTGDFVPLATNPDEPIFNFQQANMTYGTTYFICAYAGNANTSGCVQLTDPCLSISNDCAEVVFYRPPTATLAGTTTICSGESTDLTVTLTGTAPYTITYENVNTGSIETETTDQATLNIPVSPTASNEYILMSVEDANCPGTVSGNASVLVNNAPVIANISTECNATNTAYTVSFSIQSLNSMFTVNPPMSGTLSGNMFTSNPIDIASDFVFEVDDANGCGPVFAMGAAPTCSCITLPGTMQLDLTTACQTDIVTVTHNGDEVLDPNDVLGFYLVGPNGDYSTALAYNDEPTFSFDPGSMVPGVTYNICAAAGDDDGTGSPNPDDLCFITSNCTPVFWYPTPEVSIAGTTTICQGESADILFNMMGGSRYLIEYTENGVSQSIEVWSNDTTLTFTPNGMLDFNLVSVTSIVVQNGSTLECENTASGNAVIDISIPADAGQPISAPTELCEGENQDIDLSSLLIGQDPGGVWTDDNGVVNGNGIFNTFGRPADDYCFTYTLTPSSPCPVVTSQVCVKINPLPIADAGEDQTLTCNDLIAELGGNSSQGEFSYLWTGGTVSDPTVGFPTTTQGGTYTLTVENNNTGCISTDEVVIDLDNSAPIPNISISDLSCFGAQDGFIAVGPITGGAPPYECSFNGGPFSTLTTFTDLSAGQYVIVCRDSKGCEVEQTVIVEQPDELDVEIIGGFEDPNDPSIQLGDSVLISVQVNLPFDSLDAVIWTPAEAIPCDTCPSFYMSPFEEMTIQLTVQEGQCSDNDDLKIFVRKDRPVYVPNAFSPNGDGTNDKFEIYAGASVKRIKSFLVFNRWGETVWEYTDFEPNDPASGWDGMHRGQLMNPAVFIWFAEIEFIDGIVEIYEGDVSLVR